MAWGVSVSVCWTWGYSAADSGLGIDAQRERCAAYAVAMRYEPDTVAVDAGVSGTTAPDKRPATARALQDLDNGAAAVLIVASLSRLGRSTRDALDLAAAPTPTGGNSPSSI